MRTLHHCSCCGFLSTLGTAFTKVGKKLLCLICKEATKTPAMKL